MGYISTEPEINQALLGFLFHYARIQEAYSNTGQIQRLKDIPRFLTIKAVCVLCHIKAIHDIDGRTEANPYQGSRVTH